MDNEQVDLAGALAQGWWILLLRGISAIAFAVLAWWQPALTLAALVLLFGAYVLADGVLGVWAAFRGREQNRHWWLLLLWGLVGIVAGLATFVVPGLTALILLFYIAAWAIASGVLQLFTAIRLRKQIQGEFLMGLGGVISVLFGLCLIVWPGAGALSLIWLIAFWAALFGVLMVVLAFKLKGMAR